MRRTSAYSISLLVLLIFTRSELNAQDTIIFPLKIRIGIEASGPAIYFSDKNILNTEGYISADINEKFSAVIGGGYLDYKYSQYNYNYLNKGMFVRAGADFNLLKPEKSMGRYWAGIGLRYGISLFKWEVPSFQQENYWGTGTSAIPPRTNWGHFLEASPGVRAEVLKNISMGWTISLRMLLYSGTGKDQRPIYFPGFGNGGKSFSSGISYFLVWNIPYKKKTVIIPKEVPEETEETGATGTGQQGGGIRQ
jgi:hypothetical protein